MPIFLDTGKIKEVQKYMGMGIIRGVTTNPTILLKDGVTGGLDGVRERSIQIAGMIHPYPLSVEVTTNAKEEMIAQARDFSQWAENINIKITIHGPNGELDNVEVIHDLETKHNVRVNVTAMMSAQQAFLAALAGATYVSIFGGRVNNMGYNTCSEISKLRKLLDQFGLKSRNDRRVYQGSAERDRMARSRSPHCDRDTQPDRRYARSSILKRNSQNVPG